MYDSFNGRADFYLVYIAEAHASDEWQAISNESEDILIAQHTTLAERIAAARTCEEGMGLSIPTLVDGMDNAAMIAYAAWPERVYILDTDRKLHYVGGYGPWDFNPAEARAALVDLLDG